MLIFNYLKISCQHVSYVVSASLGQPTNRYNNNYEHYTILDFILGIMKYKNFCIYREDIYSKNDKYVSDQTILN